mgnify:CR=1 FL=1
MKKLCSIAGIYVVIFSVLLTGGCHPGQQPAEDWISLFNGKDLEGWTVKIKGYDTGVNYGNTFRVEEGLLKVRYDQYEEFGNRFGHLFCKDTFSHYIIRVEYRFVGEQCR